jgi:SHS2 domain-containing protein
MPYSYTEHISDIGIRAEGTSLEEAFEAGARAALAVMFVTETVGSGATVEITASAPEIDLLFVEVINEVISIIGRDELAAHKVRDSKIEELPEGGFSFIGTVVGERFDADAHEVLTEVKAATYSGLRYRIGDHGEHILECVLDI